MASRPVQLARTDWGILFIVLIMLVIGLVMVYSSSYGFALMEGGQYEGRPAFFVRRQALFALAGIVALFVFWRIDYHWYKRFAVEILLVTMGMLLVMVFFGRWLLQLPQAQSVQPVEAAKLGAVIYIAVWLEAKRDELRTINLGLVPFALLLGTIAGLIVLQPDFSTAALLIATATAMFFVAGADMKQLLIGFLFGGVAIALVILVAQYRMERVQAWLTDPLSDALGGGFQPVQSLVGLNRGGGLGVGLGQSEQKFIIYAPHTDCVFSIIGEELGFLGSTGLVLLFGLWTWRGLRVARHADDLYGSLLAVGIVAWVTFQSALHIAVVTATTPFTGTVLPFVSYGGSSLMSCLASVGILLSISRGSARAKQATRA